MTYAVELAALEAKLPVPPFVFGLMTFVALLVMMLIVLSIGKGRPHA